MNEYADAKGPLIVEITASAEAWAAGTCWTYCVRAADVPVTVPATPHDGR